MAEPVDGVLWKRWEREGDSGAFMELVLRHSRMVYGTCLRILGNGSDAEEVTQECFLELTRSGERVRTTYGGWLHGVAVKRSLMRARSDRRRRQREQAYAEGLPSTSTPTWEDVVPHLDGCIRDLPDGLREVIVLHFLEGRTYAETGHRLGVSPSTVQRRERKALDALRKLLSKRGVATAAAVVGSLMTAHAAGASAVPPALTTALGNMALAQGVTHGFAVTAGALTAGGLIMKKAIFVIIAVLAIAGAWLVSHRLSSVASRPRTDMEPPALPAELQAKVDTLTTPAEATPPPETNNPVVLAESPAEPVADPAKEPVPEGRGLQPATVRGLIRDEEQRKPISGATLELLVGVDMAGGGPPEMRYTAQAGDDGAFLIENIDTFGDACLIVSAEDYTTQRTFDSWHPSPLVLERLEPGMEYRFDFLLEKLAAVLAGRVVDSAHRPIPGARVRVVHQRDADFRDGMQLSVTDDAGQFRIELPESTQCLMYVTKPGYAFGHFPDIPANSRRVELMLYRPGAVAGQVKTASGEPVVGAELEVRGEGQGIGRPGGPWDCSFYGSAVTDENGEYRCEGLSEAFTYKVEVEYRIPGYPRLQRTARSLSEFITRQRWFVHQDASDLHRNNEIAEVGVVVKAEQTTQVDFVLDDETQSSTVFYGRVTDPDTGEPVCPIYVSVYGDVPNSSGKLYEWAVGSDVTGLDGRYRVELPGVEEGRKLTLKARYCTRRCTPRTVQTFLVTPNEEYEVNFTMPQGITVPLRTVSRTGEPIDGIIIEQVDSDAEGRLTLFGMEPNVTHEFEARTWIGDDRLTVGSAGPFSGKPGEVLPEQEVVCDLSTGQITGTIVIPDELDLEAFMGLFARFEVAVMAKCYYEEPAGRVHSEVVELDWNGRFAIEAAPPGVCSVHLFVFTDVPELQWWAFIEGVEVQPDYVTELGEIVPNPPVAEDAQAG